MVQDNWEIIAKDFGGAYKGTVEGLNLADCIAKVYVWRGSTYLLDGEACSAITYDTTEDESYCYYVVADGDFPTGSIEDDERTVYNVMVEFTKAGYQEHAMRFEWAVLPHRPA